MQSRLASLNLICLQQVPILQQLQLEEALLRTDQRNWCILNKGTSPAIVMGISGKPDELIDFHKFRQAPIPLIRRFTGGGTVFVDEHTDFVTFIFNSSEIDIAPFPQPIMQWTQKLYHPVFVPHPFDLKDNDYVLGNRKVGGNAQSICKGRWLHHSSFLWDYRDENMDYLRLPNRMPAYRQQRSHKDFLCRLCDYWPERNIFIQNLLERLNTVFTIQQIRQEDLQFICDIPHRRATSLVVWK